MGQYLCVCVQFQERLQKERDEAEAAQPGPSSISPVTGIPTSTTTSSTAAAAAAAAAAMAAVAAAATDARAPEQQQQAAAPAPRANEEPQVNQEHLQQVKHPNPSNAKATFFQSTRMQKYFEKHPKPLHVGIHWIALLSDEYPCARVSAISQFCIILYWSNCNR